jgi:hypothetical protein
MMRLLALLLLLANLLFFGWTQGWLDGPAGIQARGDREPERLSRQVNPELVQILSPQAARATAAPPVPVSTPAAPAASAAAAPASATVALVACLEAGPFAPTEVAAAEAVLRASLPDGSWVNVKANRPGLWMVYLGKLKDRDELLKRQEELRALRIEYDELRGPPELLPGLSLGRFEERGNAVNALEKFSLRGIRSAKVIEVRTPSANAWLRVDKAPAALASQAMALTAPALGKGFVPCATTTS